MLTTPIFAPPIPGEIVVCDGAEYLIGEQIGSGNFANVYECTDEWSNRLVAKVLTPSRKQYSEVHELWLHEYKNLNELRHPAITYIHAAFEYKGAFYLIVERCEQTIEHLLLDQTLTGDLWLPFLARDILYAVHHVHQRGYTHKDLHAGNVFISHATDNMVPSKNPVWSFKIGDLGISRATNEISQVGTVMAAWMLPPERYNPIEFGDVDRQVDIYHIALLLLGLLTHKTPSFSQAEILSGQPRMLAESLDSPYSLALSKALRRHVAARTPNALEFWRDIANSMPENIKARFLPKLK